MFFSSRVQDFLKAAAGVIIGMGLMLPVAAYADTAVITKGNTALPYVSLTFDDGGVPENVRSVLNTLERYQVQSTFFFTGGFIASEPQLMKELVAKGNEMGNHTYGHPDLTRLSYDRIISELHSSSHAYMQVSGQEMKAYMRPPYGAWNSAVLRAISDAGYTHTVLWDVDTNDWRGKSAAEITRHVLQNAGNGSIVLMHTTKNSKAHQALPAVIEGLQKKGYQIVPLSEMFRAAEELKTPLGPETISQVEFLNNLVFLKSGSYCANATEVRSKALAYRIIDAGEYVHAGRAVSKEQMTKYTRRAFPDNKSVNIALRRFDFKKSSLPRFIAQLQKRGSKKK
ncbi:MAG: polysaccharide deacetylase family protein [Peptostreptococcaceae bacterium]|nr:polysaccharide deacetylase family protein [Peptostreptococcaceae bacterium]